MQSYNLDVIGTHIRIFVDVSSPIGEDFSQIENRLLDFDARYSRFIASSWISELNKNRRANLDADAKKILEISLELAHASHGYFDPTVAKKLRELGYGRDFANNSISSTGQQKGERRFYNNYQDIEINNGEVILHGDIELEFGGIGKGYMLEWVTKSLTRYERYLIDFGGDIYGKGGWQVGLESPYNIEEAIGILTLSDGYFACSSGSKRKWGNHHHLINPHTGSSAQDVVATYIESSSGIIADGYATTLCVMPFSLACKTLEENPLIEGVILSKNGELFQSRGSKCELFG